MIHTFKCWAIGKEAIICLFQCLGFDVAMEQSLNSRSPDQNSSTTEPPRQVVVLGDTRITGYIVHVSSIQGVQGLIILSLYVVSTF
jgi:hypothetical protein